MDDNERQSYKRQLKHSILSCIIDFTLPTYQAETRATVCSKDSSCWKHNCQSLTAMDHTTSDIMSALLASIIGKFPVLR